MAPPRPSLFTVGYSNHTFEEFFALLSRHEVTAVADVRSAPYSRRNHFFNREVCSRLLAARDIAYVFLGLELGARREEEDAYEENCVSYERVAALPRFQDGLSRISRGAERYRIALLCAEKEPLDCHRTILVCRHLREQFAIAHIHADGQLESHSRAERRLVERMDVSRTLFEPDLSEAELIERAYELRGREIAYCRE